MVVAVNKAGDDDLTTAADHWQVWVFTAELGVSADLGDDPILLDQRTVGDFVAGVAVDRVGNHHAAADQRSGHLGLLS
jgi:hypothetical protein